MTNSSKTIRRILLVEDDDSHAYLTRYLIESVYSDVEINHVWNGKEAIDHLLDIAEGGEGSEFPDLIMLDINMPKIDGFAFLEKVREEKSIPELTVFMLSSSSLQGDIQRSQDLGASGFLVKPLDVGLFKETIAQFS